MDNLKDLLNQQAMVNRLISQNAKKPMAGMSDADMNELEAFRAEKRQKEEKAALAKAKRESKKAEPNDALTDATETE